MCSFVLLGLLDQGWKVRSVPALTPHLHACMCRISAGKSKEVSPLESFVFAQLVTVIVGYVWYYGLVVMFLLTGSPSGVLLSLVYGAAALHTGFHFRLVPPVLLLPKTVCSC